MTERARAETVEGAKPDAVPDGVAPPCERPAIVRAQPARSFAPSSAIAAPIATQMFADAIGSGMSSQDVHSAAAHGLSGSGGALPHQDAIQRSFGRHDVSGVRAHVGGRAAEGAGAMGAHAYAAGDQIAFRASPDLHLAAHEAAHVVQQRGGVQLAGGVGAAGDPYERHADAVADLVVQGKSAERLLDAHAPASPSPRGVQRAIQRWATEPAEAVVNRGAVQTRIRSASPTELSSIITALSGPDESLGGVVLVAIPGSPRRLAIADLDLAPLIAEARTRLGATTSSHAPAPAPAPVPEHPASTSEDLDAVRRALDATQDVAVRRRISDALIQASAPRADGNHHAVLPPGRNVILAPTDYQQALELARRAVTEAQRLAEDRARALGAHVDGPAATTTTLSPSAVPTEEGARPAPTPGMSLTTVPDADIRIRQYAEPARLLSQRVLDEVRSGRISPEDGARIAQMGRSALRTGVRQRISVPGAQLSAAIEPEGATLLELNEYYAMRMLRDHPGLQTEYGIQNLVRGDAATDAAILELRDSPEIAMNVIAGAGSTNGVMTGLAQFTRVVAPVMLGAQIGIGAYRVLTAEDGEHVWTAGREISGFVGGTAGGVAGSILAGIVVESVAATLIGGALMGAPLAIGISLVCIGAGSLLGSTAATGIWDTVIPHERMHDMEMAFVHATESFARRRSRHGDRGAGGAATTMVAPGGRHHDDE